MKSAYRFLEQRHNKQGSFRRNNLYCCVDITGLLSVMIVLLAIIFFNGTYIPHHLLGVAIDMTTAVTSVAMPLANREGAMLISVTSDNRIYFGENLVRSGELSEMIHERLSHGAEQKVYIQADTRARYGTVQEVVDSARSSGIDEVSFLAQQVRAPVANP